MKDLHDLVCEKLGNDGRLIGLSKSRYRDANPKSIVYFNACIFNRDLKQVWWGDIDITKDKKTLHKIAKEYKDLFYVTPEHPFRSDFNKVNQNLMDMDDSVIIYNEGM